MAAASARSGARWCRFGMVSVSYLSRSIRIVISRSISSPSRTIFLIAGRPSGRQQPLGRDQPVGGPHELLNEQDERVSPERPRAAPKAQFAPAPAFQHSLHSLVAAAAAPGHPP